MHRYAAQQGDEVAREALPPFLAYSKQELGSEAALFENGLEHLLNRPKRFSWDDLCELYRRVEDHEGGRRTLEELFAAQALDMPAFGSMMKMAGLVASPTLLYTLGNRFTLARIFSHLSVHAEAQPDGRVLVDIVIPDSHQDSPQLFKGTAGILSALPQLLGLARAHVDATYSVRRGRYLITPPASMTVVGRVRRTFNAFARGRQALAEMTEQQTLLNAQYAELQEAYAEAREALMVRRRFLSVISHELRTPLNGIVGAASALHEEKEAAAREQMSQSLDRSIVQMSGLVETILEFTRLDDGKSQPISGPFVPRQGLQEVLQKHRLDAEDKGLTFASEFSPRVPLRVSVDGQRVVQIASQLVSNAVKFTDQGSVHVQVDYDPSLGLLVEVRDTGSGIADADLDRAFEMFTQLDSSSTRRHGGIGLGLTLSRRLAEVLGGQVKLTSELGQGTVAHVNLPCTPLEDEPQPHPVAKQLRRSRALVVDDDRTNRAVMKRMLKQRGLQSAEAVDGQQASEMALAEDFDIIFMDCEMPKMDGFEATTRIRKQSERFVPIIATTAYVTDSDRARCFEVGMDDFLGKPVKSADVERVLELWFTDS